MLIKQVKKDVLKIKKDASLYNDVLESQQKMYELYLIFYH